MMYLEREMAIHAMVQLIAVAMKGDLKATMAQGDKTMRVLESVDEETRNEILNGSGPSVAKFIEQNDRAIAAVANAFANAFRFRG